MLVNKNNYQEFIVDFYDKQLTPQQEAGLMVFIETNKTYQEEFKAFSEISIEADLNITFNKESLKKNEILPIGLINEVNYNEYFIAHYDNELSNQEEQDLDIFLKNNTHLISQFELFSTTIAIPDTNIIYPNKSELKKAIIIPLRRIAYYAASIAAAILLVFVITQNLDQGLINPNNISAQLPKEQNKENIDNKNIKNTINPVEKTKKDIPVDKSVEKKTIIIESIPVLPIIETENLIASNNIIENQRDINTITSLKSLDLSDISSYRTQNTVAFMSPRIEYINLYNNIILRQQMADLQKQKDYNKKSLFGKGLDKMAAYIKGDDEQDNPILRNVSLWSLADLSIEGLSIITSSEIDIKREKDNINNTVRYSLKTKRLNLNSTFPSN